MSFNVCTLVFIAATGTDNKYLPMKKMSTVTANETDLDFVEVAFGTLKGVGQIYGFDSPTTAIAILLGILLASPISLMQVVLSAIVSVLTGMVC